MSDTNYQKAAIAFLTYGIGDFLECDKTKQALDCFGTIEDEKILKKAEILTAGFELKSNSNQTRGTIKCEKQNTLNLYLWRCQWMCIRK